MATSAATEKLANIAGWQVTLDGKDITDRIAPRLISLTLTEKRGGEADQLDLIVQDADSKMAIPRTGVVIAVRLGWLQGADVPTGLIDKGRFKVDEASHEGPPDVIVIRARSADLTDDFRVRRERSFASTTLSALAKKVAAAAGLTAKVDSSLAAIQIAVIEQHGQSDMALLRRLGREHDAVATVKAGKLILSPIGKGTTAGGRAIAGVAIARTEGVRHAYRRVDRGQYGGVEARWHDQASATRKTVKVGSGEKKPKRLKRVYHSEADAKAAAGAEAGRIARDAAEMDLELALGRPDLFPERGVTLSGFKPDIQAHKWLIAEVTHALDARGGLSTRLKLETKA